MNARFDSGKSSLTVSRHVINDDDDDDDNDNDDNYDDKSAPLNPDYDYMDDEDEDHRETSKSDLADVRTDKLLEESATEHGVNSSSSPRGKEFADYYADVDDGQKFDEDEYETTFIQPGMHYGDNVEIVEQVIAFT